ncbi:MAG: DUF6497 family protein [Brevirhabdus sp.]
MRRALALCAALVAAPAVATEIIVPSGQLIVPFEVLAEAHGTETWLILRYLAPEIADGMTYDVVEPDLDHLCATEGPRQAELYAAPVDQIIVTLLDQPLERGQSNPDVIQYFGAYRLIDGACIWEPF